MVGRVLVVDDEDTLRLTIKTRLASGGFETDAAVDGEDALEKLKHSRFDVVLLDINMPRMDGISALGVISDLYPQTDVIMLTGFADFTTAIECLKKGAKDYLVKPIDTTELITRMRSLLRARNSEAALDELRSGHAAFLLDRVFGSVRLAGRLLEDLSTSKGAKLSKEQIQILSSVRTSLDDLAEQARNGIDPGVFTKHSEVSGPKSAAVADILGPAGESLKRAGKAAGVKVELELPAKGPKIECDAAGLGGAFHSVGIALILLAGSNSGMSIKTIAGKEDVVLEFELEKSSEQAKKSADVVSKTEELNAKNLASAPEPALLLLSARRTIRNHQGSMEVRSAKGSLTVSCRLPLQQKKH